MNAARVFVFALLLGCVAPALALVAVPPLTGRVVDQTGTLSGGDIASLTQTLKDLETRKGSQIAILIVPTTDGEAIAPFALRVAEAWKIGRKKIDDGALLVIAKNDRHLRIEVGYGLEGALNDVTTKRIIDEVITPKFKSGDFAGGVSAGMSRMIAIINGEKLPEPAPEHWQGPSLANWIDPFNPFMLAFVFIVSGGLRAVLGRLVGSIATGGVRRSFGVAVHRQSRFCSCYRRDCGPHLRCDRLDAIRRQPRHARRLVRRPSSSGGWSSGSSSASGGFSGGGGSFGGGGASGSW